MLLMTFSISGLINLRPSRTSASPGRGGEAASEEGRELGREEGQIVTQGIPAHPGLARGRSFSRRPRPSCRRFCCPRGEWRFCNGRGDSAGKIVRSAEVPDEWSTNAEGGSRVLWCSA